VARSRSIRSSRRNFSFTDITSGPPGFGLSHQRVSGGGTPRRHSDCNAGVPGHLPRVRKAWAPVDQEMALLANSNRGGVVHTNRPRGNTGLPR
jgi:hypothetical protein